MTQYLEGSRGPVTILRLWSFKAAVDPRFTQLGLKECQRVLTRLK